MNKIFWAGDSTVKENTFTSYPQTGIAQGLRLYLKRDIEIRNHAENGRSTKSFIDESRLAAIYDEMREGDFLFIQFGHNDAKEEDESRFAPAYGAYQENLEKFVRAARDRKAYPVLITPLSRRQFIDANTLKVDIHGDYPDAMKAVADKLEVPIIDLYASSRQQIEDMGAYRSRDCFMHLPKGVFSNYPDGLMDNTHLKYEGAVIFAGLVAAGLKQLGTRYGELILEEVSL